MTEIYRIMRSVFVLFFAFSCVVINAQMAKWIVPPKYNYVHLIPGTNIYKGGLNDSTYIWDSNGKRILSTNNFIGPFKDNIAIVSSNNILKGIVTTNGHYVSLEGTNSTFLIDTKSPCFSCGQLLVQQNNEYYFLDQEGTPKSGPYCEAYPFFNNVATVVSYENVEKKKGSYYQLLTNDNSVAVFFVDGKKVKPEDVTFVSTPNEQHISLLIIKKDAYIYDKSNESLVRLSSDGSTNKNYFVSLNSDLLIITAQDGTMKIPLDKGMAYLDEKCILTKIELNDGNNMQFHKSKETVKQLESDFIITKSSDGSIYGIDWLNNFEESIHILPPQFQDVSDLNGTNAVVCLKDKYGVVQLANNATFSLSLNDGKDIGFMHGKYESTIQAALPDFISYNDVFIRADQRNLCEIIPVSRIGADTREGNYLKYNCNLIFPEGIDENRKDFTYNFTIEYEGLRSVSIPVKTKVWYIQQYDVSIDNYGIDKESIRIQVNVSRRTDVSTDNAYWFNVDLTSDLPITKTFKKINENVYEFHLTNIEKEQHNLWVVVNEDGCPPVKFPFEISYYPKTKKLQIK